MELDIHAVSTLGRESCQTSICRIPHHPDLQLTSCIDKEQGLQEWVLSKRSSFLQTLGSCQTSVLSDTAVCLHHVEILPQFRGCGYGTILIQQLILALKEQGFSKIILQVSGDNSAALALYKKQGFRITETLSFYLY
ncbi:MAG: GNAT family N-acetyltransferase [Brotaphodocola sp.]